MAIGSSKLLNTGGPERANEESKRGQLGARVAVENSQYSRRRVAAVVLQHFVSEGALKVLEKRPSWRWQNTKPPRVSSSSVLP